MLYYLIFIGLLAFWFCKVEIHIEGTDGWAKNLPTWRIENHLLLKLFWGGRAMTGYHAWVISFVIIFFHLPYFFMSPWSWPLEARTIGGIILFWNFEDFLWFVFNPSYGIRKFKKEFVPWHPRWIFGAPIEYWILLPFGFYLIAQSY